MVVPNQSETSGQKRASSTDYLAKLDSATLLLLFGLLCSLSSKQIVQCQEQLSSNSVEAHAPMKQTEDLDTLKYLEKLEKLDKYWSEVARPRFGRSEYKQPGANGRRQFVLLARHQQQPMINETPLADLLLQSALAQRQSQYGSNESY